MDVNVAHGLEVDGNVRALTFTELLPTMSEEFHNRNVFWNDSFIWRKPLDNGASSADFPFFGGSPEDAEHHVPGQFIEGGTLKQDKVNISVDDPLIKALRLPYADVTLSQFSLIEPSARECVRIISEKLDKRAAIVGVKAARTGAVAGVHGGGHVVERLNVASLAAAYPVSNTGADNFANDLSDMARKFDEANIPETGRVCFISPYIRQVLTRSNRLMNRDYVEAVYGSIVDRSVGMVEGFNLVVTQHLPSTNVTGDLTKYNGDFRVDGDVGQPAALCLYKGEGKGAIGGVEAGGLRGVVYWDENREVWLVKARIFVGLGQIEPWCAGEIRITTSQS